MVTTFAKRLKTYLFGCSN